MRLLLIRHGQTPHNVTGALDTAFPGAGLTELGHAQARAVPGALDREPVHGIYASPLLRTQLTAAPLAARRETGVVVVDGLEEVPAGALEMRADPDAITGYLECIAAWLHGDLAYRMPGGRTGEEFYGRFSAGVRSAARAHGPEDTVAIFSHGAAIRVFTALAAGLDPRESTELRMLNTGMGVLVGDPDRGWRLDEWRSDPLGGRELAAETAHDVTGESVEAALDEFDVPEGSDAEDVLRDPGRIA